MATDSTQRPVHFHARALFHQRQRESGSLAEQSHRNSIGKPQRVEHELEADFRARHFVLLEQGRSLLRPIHVLLRLLIAHLPHDAAGKRDLRMRSGANPQIIAESPIVQVVAALVARTGMRRGFIVYVAGRAQLGIDQVPDVRGQLIVWKLRRMTMEQGVRLDRQMIKGDVWRRDVQSGRDVGARVGNGLAGQRIHQIQIDVVEDFERGKRGRPGFVLVVNASEHAEKPRVEALHAQ